MISAQQLCLLQDEALTAMVRAFKNCTTAGEMAVVQTKVDLLVKAHYDLIAAVPVTKEDAAVAELMGRKIDSKDFDTDMY